MNERDPIELLQVPNLGQACNLINDSLTRFLDVLADPDTVDTFDASCNTCKHFQRKAMTSTEKAERNLFGMPGRCAKYGTSVRGWQRGQFCGFENGVCYENRRTGKRQAEAKFVGAE